MIALEKKLQIDKTVPIPLYYQLKKALLELIQNGTLQDGDMLPPEKDLADALDISRPTVRQALGELVNEGYLTRHKGRGTFVMKPKVEARFLSTLESFNHEMLQKGLTPSTKVLSLKVVEGNPTVNEQLQLPLSAPLLYLERLRSADGVALVYLETWVPHTPFPALADIDFTRESLYASLEELCGTRVQRVTRDIEAINASPHEAELLSITPGQALSLVRTVAFAEGQALPVEYSVARYRGDLNRFHVELER